MERAQTNAGVRGALAAAIIGSMQINGEINAGRRFVRLRSIP
jgi:hypothetical protein